MNIFSTKDLEGVQQVLNPSNGHAKSNGVNGHKEDQIDLNEQSRYIQQLIEEIEEWPDKGAQELMNECLQEVLKFYGLSIGGMMSIIGKSANGASTQVYNDLITDNVVSNLLLIHDLHPLDLKTRLYQALEKVKPYMDSHGGSVEIVSLENNVAHLKLSGSCKGCPSSSSTLELGIRQAVEELCPDLVGLEVEGIVAPDQIKHQPKVEPGWRVIHGVDGIKEGAMIAMDIDSVPVLIANLDQTPYAYRNHCPACDKTFTSGKLEDKILSCQLGHRYDLQHAGICVDDKHIHLDPFPLVQDNGTVKIAIG